MTDFSIARFASGVSPDRLDQFVPSEFAPVFEPLSYTPWTPSAEQVRGEYTITRSGAVLPSPSLTRRLQYANPLSRLRANAISAASMVKRGKASLPESEAPVGIVHSQWTAGYYHWLTEGLPRALAVLREFPGAVPALPSERYRPWEESVRALGFDDVRYFPGGKNLETHDPVLTDCPENFATTSPEALADVVRTITSNLGIESARANRKVYISREGSRGRFVINEAEVRALLSDRGFEIVRAETLGFRGQVELLHSTKTLVSIHGAGLTNAMFMQPGSAMVELLPRRNGIVDYHKSRNSFRHDACYVRLAAAMQLTYAYLICDHDAPFYRGTHMSNIEVDLEKLQTLVEKLEEDPS